MTKRGPDEKPATPLMALVLVLAAGLLSAARPVAAQTSNAELPAAQSSASTTTNTDAARPGNWAAPVSLDGVPNLHRVAPTIYRSAQPEAAGFANLAKSLGVKTVISLRHFHSDRSLAKGQSLELIRVPMNTWDIDDTEVIRALRNLRTASKKGPVLLHCQHGADRTGLITALYRVLYEGWTKAAALDEMRQGKFGYHAVWGNIPSYIRRVNVERLKRQVGSA